MIGFSPLNILKSVMKRMTQLSVLVEKNVNEYGIETANLLADNEVILDAPIINLGYHANPSKKYYLNEEGEEEIEVLTLLEDGNQTAPLAILTFPDINKREWLVGTSGVQSLEDKKQALEFNPIRVQIRGDSVAIGDKGEIELKDGKIFLRAPVIIDGDLSIKGNVKITKSLSANDGHYNQLETVTLVAPVAPPGAPGEPVVNIVDVPPFKEYKDK